VTGGGLPAEIWHEVMTRVDEGVPVSELPMIVPEPRQPPQAAQPEPQAQPAAPQQDDPVESFLKDLLGGGKKN
jgi:membrane peptidoglycan carboxypeptidase